MTVSPEWITLLTQARAERAGIWETISQEAIDAGEVLPENADEIGALYSDLRIDFGRLTQAIEAGGDLSVIEIDPRPEDAPSGEATVLDAYFTHFRKVIDETCRRHGLKEVDLSSRHHSDLFDETERHLFEAGESLNPLI